MSVGEELSITKALGELVGKEGLTSWKTSPQVEDEIWCDISTPFSYRSNVEDLTSPSQKSESTPDQILKVGLLQQELRRYKLLNSKLAERNELLEARQAALQLRFSQFKLYESEKNAPKKTDIRKLKVPIKLKHDSAKVTSASPTRAERKEIDVLREQNAKLIEEIKSKDTRHRLIIDKMNRTIITLQGKVDEFEKIKSKIARESIKTGDREPIIDMFGYSIDISPRPQSICRPSEGELTTNIKLEYPDQSAVGTIKRVSYPNGFSVYTYPNKDIKRVYPDGTIVYYSAETDAYQTIGPQGIKVTRFSNGQVEKTYADGSMKVRFTDGTVKWSSSEGEVEIVYSDGVRVKKGIDGTSVITHPSGKVLRDYRPKGSP